MPASFRHVLICASLSLSACQGAGPTAPNPALQRAPLKAVQSQSQTTNQVMQFKANARLLDAGQAQPIAITPQTLVFAQDPLLQMGQIVMGRTEQEDYLRRVTGIRSEESNVVVMTERANLYEAFEQLDVSNAQPDRLAPIQLDQRRFKIGFVDIVSKLVAEPDFSDSRLRLTNTRARALFVRLAPEIKLTWEVSSETRFTPGMSDGLALKPIGQMNFKTFRIPTSIGGIPLVFYLRPGTALDWGHQGEGHLKLGAQVTGSFKVGVEMTAAVSEQPTVETFYQQAFDGRVLPPEIDFNGKVLTRLHLPRLRLDSKIVDMVGPFIEAESYLDGELDAQLKVSGSGKQVTGQAAAHLGLGLKAGLSQTDLFGKTLNKEISVDIFNRRVKTLYKQRLSYQIPLQ